MQACCFFTCKFCKKLLQCPREVKVNIPLSKGMPTLQARRRRYFENTQDEKKRRIKDGHMKKSK